MPMGYKFGDRLWLDWPESSQLSPVVFEWVGMAQSSIALRALRWEMLVCTF